MRRRWRKGDVAAVEERVAGLVADGMKVSGEGMVVMRGEI